MKKLFSGVMAAVLAAAALTGGCSAGERTPRRLADDFKYEVTREIHTVEYGEITLYGELYQPEAEGKFPAVILSHGYNGHYTDFPAEMSRFAERGYVCYSFDYCGAQAGGKSAGRTGDDYTPFTMKEDLSAVIKHIKTLPNVDKTQIFLFGGSQGGFVTAITAADNKIKDQVSAVALYFPAFNISEDWSAKYPDEASLPAEDSAVDFWGYKINGKFIRSVYHYDPFEVIGDYEKDVCIVWGDQDPIVRRQFIDRAVEVYGDRAELTVINGAGHGFGGEALSTAVDTVLKFLETRTFEC